MVEDLDLTSSSVVVCVGGVDHMGGFFANIETEFAQWHTLLGFGKSLGRNPYESYGTPRIYG